MAKPKKHSHEAALVQAKQIRTDCLAWIADVAKARDEDMLTKGKAAGLAAMLKAASAEISQCENIMAAKAENANKGKIEISVDLGID